MSEPGLNEVMAEPELRARILRRFAGSTPHHELADWRLLGIDAEGSRRLARVGQRLQQETSFGERRHRRVGIARVALDDLAQMRHRGVGSSRGARAIRERKQRRGGRRSRRVRRGTRR